MASNDEYVLECFSRFTDGSRGGESKRFVDKHVSIIRPASLERAAIKVRASFACLSLQVVRLYVKLLCFTCVQFSETLVRLGVNRVSMLSGGTEVLQRRGLLASSSQGTHTNQHIPNFLITLVLIFPRAHLRTWRR